MTLTRAAGVGGVPVERPASFRAVFAVGEFRVLWMAVDALAVSLVAASLSQTPLAGHQPLYFLALLAAGMLIRQLQDRARSDPKTGCSTAPGLPR